MDIVRGATRLITRTASATAAAAGAVGGAAITGVIGGVQGTVSGIRNGLANGNHSTPAAALTLGVIGAAGLVEWPILLTVGGTALVVDQTEQAVRGTTGRRVGHPNQPGQQRRWRPPPKVDPTQVDIGDPKVCPWQGRRRPSSFDQPYVLS